MTRWLRKEVLSAIIGLIVAGVGGAGIQRYVARSKPRLVVTSVGFYLNEDETVQMPDPLVALSANSRWERAFNRYESMGLLKSRERGNRETLQAMRTGQDSVKHWRDLLRQAPDNVSDELVKEFPGFHLEVVGNLLNGAVATSELPQVPEDAPTVSNRAAIGTINERNDAVGVRVGGNGMDFAYRPDYDDRDKGMCRLMAMSLAHGSKKNLIVYCDFFLRKCDEETIALQRLNDSLQAFITEHAHLLVSASIINSGGTATTIRPYLAINVRPAVGQNLRFALAINEGEKAKAAQKAMIDTLLKRVPAPTPIDEDRGSEAHADDFLRTSSAAPYISVAPGEVKEVLAISVEALDQQAKGIRALYDGGTLACTLVALTTDGKRVKSDEAPFGEKLGTQEQQYIVAAIDKGFWR